MGTENNALDADGRLSDAASVNILKLYKLLNQSILAGEYGQADAIVDAIATLHDNAKRAVNPIRGSKQPASSDGAVTQPTDAGPADLSDAGSSSQESEHDEDIPLSLSLAQNYDEIRPDRAKLGNTKYDVKLAENIILACVRQFDPNCADFADIKNALESKGLKKSDNWVTSRLGVMRKNKLLAPVEITGTGYYGLPRGSAASSPESGSSNPPA